ncbi:MAG: substrate-binding domain-containing protein [Fimbriimonadaceae bacterium]
MRFRLFALAAGIALAMGGCGKSEDSGTAAAAPAEEKLRIAVIPKGSTHEFWKSVREGAEKAGAELGVEIIWKGPQKEDDRESQIKTVEDFVSQRVDGIVLAPLDEQALVSPVQAAQEAGIPVVIIDSGLKDEGTVSFVATDNENGGMMAGAELARLLNGKGRVVMLRYQVGSASTDARERGFLKEIAKFPGIQVVSENKHAGPTVETAQKESENLLSQFRNPDGSLGVDGIFCPNESSAYGMLLVLRDRGWAGKVKFVGFDASEKLIDGLTSGGIDGLIVQNPRNMGYEGVKAMIAHLKKEPVEKRIDTGAVLVTKANMEDEKVKELLAPPKG